MAKVDFVSFNSVEPDVLLQVVNEPAIKKHLIDHENFTSHSIKEWINGKLEIDSLEGCRIRAVYIDGVLAGWCGIQPDDNGFELAIVISQKYWGFGRSIFKIMMGWAKEMGHREVLFHLLETRPEYKALNRIATRVHKTELLGNQFTTYYLVV